MIKHFLLLILLFSFIVPKIALGVDEREKIKLKELLNASGEIANSTSSRWVNVKIPGQKIQINGKLLEIRFFSFEDTAKNYKII